MHTEEVLCCVHPGCIFVAVSEQGWFNKPCMSETHTASEVSMPVLRAVFPLLGSSQPSKGLQEETICSINS